MKNNIPCLYIFFLLLVFSSCNDDHMRRDMINFDRAFIPVFYNATLGDALAAEIAMHPLRAKWEHYQSAHHLTDKESEDWKETIRLIGAWLDETTCALDEKDVYRALVQLDHARYELVDLRLRSNMDDYYLDYVWDLEASMYNVIELSNDLMLDRLQFNEFTVFSEDLEAAWLNVVNRTYDKNLFHCTPDQLRHVNYQKNKLAIAVSVLLEAVETADRCLIADAALAIEPAYLNYLAMFGDFEATETFFALEK